MTVLMLVHIAAGGIALVSGAAALALRKGSRRHARVGVAFLGSMLAMGLTGALIAALRPAYSVAVIGILTCYFVVTSWAAAKYRDGRASPLDHAALVVVLGCASAMFWFGMRGLNNPAGLFDGLSYPVFFQFATVAALAAAFDIHFILRGHSSGVQRIGRHVWRMCLALGIAASSFFRGQRDEFPDLIRDLPVWDLPPLAVIAAMIFWSVRVRFSKAYRHWPPRVQKPAEPAMQAADSAKEIAKTTP